MRAARGSVSVNCRKVLHFQCVCVHTVCTHMHICMLRMHAYVSAGLSTYFYGLSARLHVFLRAERGQAHNSLGTAFIRSAAGVVIVVFPFLFFVVAVPIHMRKERRLLLLLLGFYQVHLKCAREGASGSWR